MKTTANLFNAVGTGVESSTNHIYGQILIILLPISMLAIGWFIKRLFNQVDQGAKERQASIDQHQMELKAQIVEVSNQAISNQRMLTTLVMRLTSDVAHIQGFLRLPITPPTVALSDEEGPVL